MATNELVRASGFSLLVLVVLYFVLGAMIELVKQLRHAQPDPERKGEWLTRIKFVITDVFGQRKLLRNLAGYGHLVIFYGFIFITIVTLEVFIRVYIPNFSLDFLGPGYTFLLVVEDILSVGVLIALVIGFLRRYVHKPLRFEEIFETERFKGSLNKDATIILFAVGIHIVFALLLESLEIASGNHPRAKAAIVSNQIATIWSGSNIELIEEVVWWAHSLSVLVFLIYIFGTQTRVPGSYPSKHFHILSAAINIAFGTTKPAGRLRPMTKNTEEFENLMEAAFEEDEDKKKPFGISTIGDLRWPQLLDLHACTGCGRCQELCPAYLNGQPLSPKALILNMRELMLETASRSKQGIEEPIETPLIGGFVMNEALWACTTCGACQDACPVSIEHIDMILDMRRYLTMIESEFPPGVEKLFNNIETNYNPWGVGKSERDKWADALELKRMKDHPDTEVLFWVGCAGSFDNRAKKVSTALVKILKTAEIDFAILGNEEKCTGDPARRIGNEYLAVEMMTQNVSLLNSYNFKEIITFCPHCFNNLQNELPDFDGHYKVVHSVDFISKLLASGKIQLDTAEPLDITYHDSCYLGRHNGIYSAPRQIIEHFSGVTFVEMDMNKDKGLCCGAGGGRMFYEAEGGSDINKMRVKMAEDCGAKTIGVSCPFCSIMLDDGIKNMNSTLEVTDLTVIVASRLKSN